MKNLKSFPGSNNSGKSRLSWPYQILVLCLTNLIFFVILLTTLEIYLSLTDPKLKLPPTPEETKNQYGFRGRDFVVPKPPGVCRIMALGDSFTWGKGVWVEERYTNLAEGYLNQSYPYRKFEVLNFGFPGAHTAKERDSLAEFKDTVQPDLITLGFVLNDSQPRRQNYSPQREYFEENYGVLLEDISDKGHQYHIGDTTDMVLQAFENSLILSGLIPSWEEAMQEVYKKDSPQWQEFEQALQDIKSMSDEMNLPPPIFLVLNQGTYTDRPTNYREPDEELQLFLEWYDQAEETAARLGFNTMNFEKEFADELSDEIMAANILDNHPSPHMHRIYARKLYEEIARYVDEEQICRQPWSEPPMVPAGPVTSDKGSLDANRSH